MRISTSGMHAQALAAMLLAQGKLAKVQQQLTTGQRLTSAADDPIAASSGIAMDQTLAELDRYGANALRAASRLHAEESALDGVVDVIQRVQELAVQVNNGAYGDTERKAISAELHQRYDQLLALANSGDGAGRYLFGGAADGSAPFAGSSSGGVTYSGDSGQRLITVAPGVDVADGDPGVEVFQRIDNGNGTFAVTSSPANSGDAVITSAKLSDPPQWLDDTYTIDVTGGNYTVTGAASGVVASGTYASGAAISFAGASIVLTGTPQNGDTWTVAPSVSQDVFTTLRRLINAVDTPAGSPAVEAQRRSEYFGAQTDLAGALTHILTVRSAVGTRLSSLDTAESQREAAKLDVQSALSGLRDTDYNEAVTRMNLLMTALQAAQQTYQKIQGTSLFDYLR